MATVAAMSTDVEIMSDPHEALFWEMVRHFERPPYFFPDEGVNNRLNKAARLVYEHRITPNVDGSYAVEGSGGRQYRISDRCSCPQAQKGKSHWCYHHVGVVLYIEWQRRLGYTPQGLPRQPALRLPPVTVDERLSQPPAPAPTMPQEVPMTDDPDPYIPEPDPAPVAVLDDPVPPPEPVRVSIPAEYVITIKGQRHVLYAGLVIGAQKSGLMSLSADWTYNDAELSLAHAVATFADGRRYEDSGDASPSNVTKGIASHFRRVALTRAKARCLRDALGIQECSVEEIETEEREVPDMTRQPTELALKQRIWRQVQAADPSVQSREACAAYVQRLTGLPLEPDHYAAIARALESRRP